MPDQERREQEQDRSPQYSHGRAHGQGRPDKLLSADYLIAFIVFSNELGRRTPDSEIGDRGESDQGQTQGQKAVTLRPQTPNQNGESDQAQ